MIFCPPHESRRGVRGAGAACVFVTGDGWCPAQEGPLRHTGRERRTPEPAARALFALKKIKHCLLFAMRVKRALALSLTPIHVLTNRACLPQKLHSRRVKRTCCSHSSHTPMHVLGKALEKSAPQVAMAWRCAVPCKLCTGNQSGA